MKARRFSMYLIAASAPFVLSFAMRTVEYAP
jgi:hypothetical protein